ncbi:Guanosine-diphosphatase, partial [Borealophlyctis nickersoniae]
MIDAGSSGSRIHIYRFNYCTSSSPTLESEVFRQLKPGLSSPTFVTPEEAANSLDPLLKVALDAVPRDLWACTPVEVKATAGLRMKKPAGSGEEIVKAVRRKLENEYPFMVGEGGVGVMDGKDEGIFAWITVNYLLKRIGQPTRSPTAAIMDLGGGSTQIVFEPSSASGPLEPGDHLATLTFSPHTYTLYQHSYDGYGLNAARNRIKSSGVASNSFPCYAVSHAEDYTDPTTGQITKWTGSGTGDFSSCHTYISQTLFDKSPDKCLLHPCSFAGTYQPSLEHTFAENDIYAFSYFYDKYAEPFRALGDHGFTVGAIRHAAEKVCSGTFTPADLPVPPGANSSEVAAISDEIQALFGDPDWCTDLGFMYGLLSVGYGIGDDRVLKT